MGKSLDELQAENEMLRSEIKVAREAADITSDFVVRQFEQTEQMLSRFQMADAERQAVLDAATQLSIIATDNDGIIQLFSRGGSTLLGYKSSDMVGKVNILSLHLPDEIENYGKEISGVVESSLAGMAVFGQYVKQKKTLGQEWLYICHDSKLLEVNLSITGLYDSGGRKTGYLFTAMDLSAHKQLEFELMKARDVAESANASKGDFLARMSHEIRTPMNGIIGMSHLLQKTELDAQQRNYAEKVLGSANTLLRLINDILDFSKIDAGKLELESIPFNLEDVLGNVANVVGMQTEEKGLEFLFHVDSQVPYNLMGDPLRLGQVLMNLAGNAVKFTSEGEIVITVSTEEVVENSVKLRFTVRDTGIGLHSEQVKHLFTAFNQADDSITRKYGGTGLGLAICKQLTEMMGGCIWAESVYGQGSDFIFTIQFGLATESRLSEPKSMKVFKGLRALVVDDNKAAREVLVSMLSSLQMEVDSVNDGLSAIEYLEKAVIDGNPYDVVLLDWVMPGIDGIETARRIKENAALAKVPAMLMVTANGREEAYVEADQVGLDAFLLKPVYGSVIYNTLLQILGIKTVTSKRAAKNDADAIEKLQKIKGSHILLVDDNPINQEVGIAFLQDVGMVVEVASNGQESLDALAQKKFDLVLMDIQMPGMDGLEATRRIRRSDQWKDLPVIAMTAHAMAGDREKSLAAGMNEHINKPIDPALLYQALQKWIPEKGSGKSELVAEPVADPVTEPVTVVKEEPKIELPVLPGIDQKEALRRLNNKSQLFLKMLKDFQHSFAAYPTVLHELSIAGEWSKIGEKAHTVKGVSSYIGATSLFQAASELEATLIEGKQELATLKLPLFIDSLDEILSSLALLPVDHKEPEKNGLSAEGNGLDISIIAEKINTLIHLLQQGEFVAEEHFQALKKILIGQGHDKILFNIEEMIDNIDFEEAAEITSDLLNKLQQGQQYDSE